MGCTHPVLPHVGLKRSSQRNKKKHRCFFFFCAPRRPLRGCARGPTMKIPSRLSGPLVLGFMGCATCLVAAVAYSRAVLGEPLRLTHDADGVVRFLTREEALRGRLEASERLALASPGDVSRARVTAIWREAVREAQAAEATAAQPRAQTAEELTL